MSITLCSTMASITGLKAPHEYVTPMELNPLLMLISALQPLICELQVAAIIGRWKSVCVCSTLHDRVVPWS